MKCAHPQCDCIDPTFPFNGEFYCDSACAVSSSRRGDGCGCQHASCTAAGAVITDDDTDEPAAEDIDTDYDADADAEDAVPQASTPLQKQKTQRGATSPVPVVPPSDDRRRRNDLGSNSSRSDSSRRPDIAPDTLEVPTRPQPKGRAART